jgi:thioredoxin-like negative regulator of GroEL
MAKQVIKFYANWCGPCKVYGPTFTKVREELESDEITFLEINIEDDPDNLAGEYGVRGIPHTVIVEEGGDLRGASGRLGADTLKKLILN